MPAPTTLETPDVLYRLTDQVVDVLGIDGAGVSLRRSLDELEFVTATDDRASHVETSQIQAAEGPCYEAFRSGKVVAVPDIARDGTWPDFRESAVAQGFGAVAGIPMPVDEEPIGALDLYCGTRHEWTGEELDVAQLLANVASGYVLNWRSLDEKETLAEQLQQALDSRIVIEQAKGVLVERHDIDPGAAFQELRQHARDSSTRIHDVARRVVSRELRL